MIHDEKNKRLYATPHEAALIASLPEGGTGMLCREVKALPSWIASTPPPDVVGKWCHFYGDHPAGVCGHPKCGCQKIAHEKPNPVMWTVPSPFPLGAVLAVKEAWCDEHTEAGQPTGGYLYCATEDRLVTDVTDINRSPWLSGARMPARAVRSYIRITGLRVALPPDFTAMEAAQWMRTYQGDNPPRADRYYWLYTFEKVSREEVAHA